MTKHQALRLLHPRDRQSVVFRGSIAFLIVQQPLENQMMQWTAHDNMESKGWWDQQTLGHTFSKSCLDCPSPTNTFTCCRRRQNSCSAHKKYAGINSLGHCCLTQRHAHTWFCFSTHCSAFSQGPGWTLWVM